MINKDLLKEARSKLLFFILTVLFGIGIGLIIILQAHLLSKIIAAVFIKQAGLEFVWSDITNLIIVIFIRSLFVFIREMASGEISAAVMFSLRNRIFSKILNLNPIDLGNEQTGELATVIFQGVEKLDAYFREYLPQMVLATSIPILVLIVVFPVDLITGVIFFVTAPLIPLFMILIGQQAENETKRQWNLLSKLSGHYFDILQGLETLKNYGLSKHQSREIKLSSEKYALVTLRVLRIAFLSAFVLEILATISTAVVAVQIGLRLMYGEMIFADGLFLLMLAPEFYFPLRQLGAGFHAGKEGLASAERIFTLLEQNRFDGSKPSAKGSSIINFCADIDFTKVSYQYPTRDQPSVTDLSFRIQAGQKVALVGKSGSGKSTVVALVMGFIFSHEGEVRVDGVQLNPNNIIEWRKNTTYVPQFPHLFDGTVEDNMRIAKSEATWQEIKYAATLANAEDFIKNLPGGYQTRLGENGAKLSRGQAQRLALARAFLREAPLLVIDEPFASLDSQNDQRIVSALNTLMKNRTTIIVAHRLSTAVNADKIIVLEKGKIEQIGTHNQLQRQGGKYSELVQHAGIGL